MSEAKESRLGGVFKALGSSLIGALSGAIIMYLSPLVNSAIKPPKPVPNFSYSLDGATATFINRSTGGTQGWWDFGDGSALEPFSHNQASIVHRFPGPGAYAVKLSLHNLIGEEVERSAPVKIDAATPPSIDDFKVVSVASNRSSGSKNPSAPATFRVTGQLKNADLVIWSVDDHPLELQSDVAHGSLERYVTFASYGPKKIRLMAVSGKLRVEREADVWVDVPDDDPMILIQQTSFAAEAKTMPISVSFPAQFNGPSYPFEISRRVGPDAVIVDATLDPPSERLVRDAKLKIAADKKSFTVTGELLRPAGMGGMPASWFGKVELMVANRASASLRKASLAFARLQLPGRTIVGLPKAHDGAFGGFEWELRTGMDVVYKDVRLPASPVVRFGSKTYRVSVTPVGEDVVIESVEAPPAVPLISTSSPR